MTSRGSPPHMSRRDLQPVNAGAFELGAAYQSLRNVLYWDHISLRQDPQTFCAYKCPITLIVVHRLKNAFPNGSPVVGGANQTKREQGNAKCLQETVSNPWNREQEKREWVSWNHNVDIQPQLHMYCEYLFQVRVKWFFESVKNCEKLFQLFELETIRNTRSIMWRLWLTLKHVQKSWPNNQINSSEV